MWRMAALLVLASCGFEVPPLVEDAGTPANVVGFAASQSQQDERSDVIEVKVRLERPAETQITARYEFVGGSATPDDPATPLPDGDYAGMNGEVVFEPGQMEKSFTLRILPDNYEESNEDIDIMLTSADGAVIGAAVHEVLISANLLSRVNFSLTESTGPETGTVSLNLELDQVSLIRSTVQYTVSGTATSADHVLVAGEVVFQPEVSSMAIPLPITVDMLDEFDETVIVTLSSSTDVVIGPVATRTHTIVDDDAEPTLSIITTTAVTETNSLVTANVAVSLNTPSGKMITVSFANLTGTAQAADYQFPTTTTLTFAPGVTMQSIPIGIVGDTTDEDAQTVVTQITGPVNAMLSSMMTVNTLTITDDDNPPTVAWVNPGNAMVDEGDSGETMFVYNMQLSQVSEKPVAYAIATSGDATRDTDYTISATTFMIPAGETDASVTVNVIGDTAVENNSGGTENVTMTISGTGLTNVTVGTPSARTHTIKDDDP